MKPTNDKNDEHVLKAIAKHSFSGRNNDELSFSKNEIVTILQRLDGGWWEGSVDGKIGWFPSNFVELIVQSSDHSRKDIPSDEIQQLEEKFHSEQITFRRQILSDFLKNEKLHIKELEHVLVGVSNCTKKLSASLQNEWHNIMINLNENLKLKESLLEKLESTISRNLPDQRVGEVFMLYAQDFQTILQNYCECHPLIVELINKHRNTINEALKAVDIEYKNFVSGLSLVFRHAEKYPIFLQETERNTPENHSDKGNLHRSIAVYWNIYNFCVNLRRQKEVQLEFLSSGKIKEWYGENYTQELGDIIYIGNVQIGSNDNLEHESLIDRCLIIFDCYLLLTEILLKDGSYLLKDSIRTSGMLISKRENDLTLFFKKDKKLILKIIALTNEDYLQIVNAIEKCSNIVMEDEFIMNVDEISPYLIDSNKIHKIEDLSTPSKPIVYDLPQPTKATLNKKLSINAADFRLNHELEMILPDTFEDDKPITNPTSTDAIERRPTKLWSGNCLRPLPANNNSKNPQLNSSRIKLRKGLSKEEQDDMFLLKIVEGYIQNPVQTPSFNRSGFLSSASKNMSGHDEIIPQVIVADEEKIFVEELEGDEMVIKERSLVDTVYSLKDQINVIRNELELIVKTLEKEQKSRRRLEEYIRRSSQHYSLSSTPKPTSESLDDYATIKP